MLATGFHPNKYLWPMEITGRGGRVLHDEWGDDPRAYLGITVPGFPNLFCLYGPNTNPVVGSVIFVLECQVNYVVKAIGAHARARVATDGVPAGRARRVQRAGRRRARAPRVAAPAGAQLLQQRRRSGHHQHALAALDYWRMTHEPALDDFVVTGR